MTYQTHEMIDDFTPTELSAHLLYKNTPTLAAIQNQLGASSLTDDLGMDFETVDENTGVIKFSGFEQVVLVAIHPTPDALAFPDTQLAFTSEDDEAQLRTHTGYVELSITPRIAECMNPREEITTAVSLQTFLLQILAESAEVLGLHYLPAGTAFGREFIDEVFFRMAQEREEVPVAHQFAVRSREKMTGHVGWYTIGLRALGHPELQVEHSPLEPNLASQYLYSSALFVARGEQVLPGQSLKIAPEGRYIRPGCWLGDLGETALEMGF